MLIDCDLRKPQVHRFFDLDNKEGFTSVLLQEETLISVARQISGEKNLLVVTSGPLPPDPSELLAGDAARQVLEGLGGGVDLVVIDSPPVLPVADPLVLASIVDGVILVASAASTDTRQVTRAVERLRQVDAPLLGTVFNGFDPKDSDTYAYGYEGEVPDEEADTPQPKSAEQGATEAAK